MKRLAVLVLVLVFFGPIQNAAGDWRWPAPKLKPQTIHYKCDSLKCIKKAFTKERQRFKKRVARYDKRRLAEWNRWTKLYIPQCTWYGESGTSAQFSPIRYTIPNSQGSGAY